MVRRLLLSFIVVVVVTVLAMLWATTSTINSSFDSFRGTHLDAHLHHIPHQLLSHYRQQNSWSEIDATIDNMSRSLNMDIALTDGTQTLLAATSTEINSIAQQQDKEAADFVIPLKEGTPGELIGTAYFKSSSLLRQRDQEFLRRLSISALWVGLGVALLASLLSYGIARSVSQPIVELSQAAETVARGNYAVQVDATRDDEVGILGRAFNQMATEIGNLEKVRRNLVINVSHDLRTPLTVVSGYLEGLRTGKIVDRRSAEVAFDIMDREVKALIKLIESLNEVAALDSGEIPLTITSVSIPYLITQAVERIQPVADAKGVEVTQIQPSDGDHMPLTSPAQLDVEKMGQALYNLLDNAIHYSPAGGTIQIGSTIIEDPTLGEQVQFTVEDWGEGVPPEHQPYIFQRFYRADSARNRQQSGYGMGLSIVQSIAHAHGGQVHVVSSGVGGEVTRFTVTVPRAVPHLTKI